MLTGAAAAARPDIDRLAPAVHAVAIHQHRQIGDGVKKRRYSGTGDQMLGRVNPDTGAYIAYANTLGETGRRQAGLRRNGAPRRRVR